jgi:DNA-directed RNA polymerase specialized sigma24 family protein
MTTEHSQSWCLMGQADAPPSVLFGETEPDLWPYRIRTIALLRRYARASVEVGRLPSLLGREFFRSRVTSYSMGSFEDIVIFVADMELTIEELDTSQKKLLAMHVLEERNFPDIARLLGCSERTADRIVNDAIDKLSQHLLIRGMLERLPEGTRGCQGGKN